MSSLFLVRHGQASAHAADYDVLSAVGARQARALGRALRKWIDDIDAVYRGPRRRHQGTFEHMRDEADAHGFALPDATVLDEFDEMEVGRLFQESMSRVLPSCPDLREQLASGQIRDDGRQALRHMGGITMKLLERWAAGEELGLGIEPFEAFTSRVREGIHRVMKAEKRGRRVMIVTSGGPISVALRMALGVDARRSMALMYSLTNASMTELRYTEHELSVETYNQHSHLVEEGIVTKL
jgi:broad specificity phosphatase PhoE